MVVERRVAGKHRSRAGRGRCGGGGAYPHGGVLRPQEKEEQPLPQEGPVSQPRAAILSRASFHGCDMITGVNVDVCRLSEG